MTDNKRLTRLWPRAGKARLRKPGGRHGGGGPGIRHAALAGVLVMCTAGGPTPLGLADRGGPPQEPATAGADGHAPLNLVPPPAQPPQAADHPPAHPTFPGGLWPGQTGSWAGVPRTVLAAYQRAATRLAAERPGCRLPVALLAGIGKVESDHAEGGAVDSTGTTLLPILGPVLNGSGGNAAIPNTYGTRWAQQGPWARAVGPMQFIPSTWAHWGRGGDPSNVYDAALAAARYLCADGRDLATPWGLRSAVLSYNDSAVYLSTVLEWMAVYSGQITTVPDSPSMPPSGSGSGSDGTAGGAASPGPRHSAGGRPAPRPKPSGGSGATPSPTTPPQPSPSPTPAPGGLPSLGPVVGGAVGGVTKTVSTTVTKTVTKTVGTVTGVVGSLLPPP